MSNVKLEELSERLKREEELAKTSFSFIFTCPNCFQQTTSWFPKKYKIPNHQKFKCYHCELILFYIRYNNTFDIDPNQEFWESEPYTGDKLQYRLRPYLMFEMKGCSGRPTFYQQNGNVAFSFEKVDFDKLFEYHVEEESCESKQTPN